MYRAVVLGKLGQLALYVSAAGECLLHVTTKELILVVRIATTPTGHDAVAFGAWLVAGTPRPSSSYA